LELSLIGIPSLYSIHPIKSTQSLNLKYQIHSAQGCFPEETSFIWGRYILDNIVALKEHKQLAKLSIPDALFTKNDFEK